MPYGADALLTEDFDRLELPHSEEWLLLTTNVDDPAMLTKRFVVSSQFKRESDDSKWNPTPCRAIRSARPPTPVGCVALGCRSNQPKNSQLCRLERVSGGSRVSLSDPSSQRLNSPFRQFSVHEFRTNDHPNRTATLRAKSPGCANHVAPSPRG